MSRKDTIIVAVLINAGLLIVLFASALKSNSSTEFAAAPTPMIQEPFEPAAKKETPVAGDEVDQALSQFSQNSVAATTLPTAPQTAMPMTNLSPAAPSSFADDLQAIVVPEVSPVPLAQASPIQTLTAPITSQNKPASEFIEVKVKKGDVLEKIARHHHTTVAEIMKANKLSSTNLRIGQVLKIPSKTIKKAEVSSIAHTAVVPSTSGSFANDNSAKFYTVKKGDSPWTIAVKNHLKVEELLKLNNMNEDQARRLKPGDQLRIK